MRKKIPTSLNENIPEINFFKRAFKKFKQVDEQDYDKIINNFVSLFNSFPIIPYHFANSDILSELKVYRVISEHDLNKYHLDKDKLSSFSHPPKESTLQQRFNIKNFPVFYGAETEHTAIQEKYGDLSKDDTIYISEWKFNDKAPLGYIMLCFGYDKGEYFQNISQSLKSNFEKNFKNYTKDKRKSLQYFFEKITEMSLTETFNSVTSAFGHYYLYRAAKEINPTIGFIMYPSIKKVGNGYNFAVNPDIITNNSFFCTQIRKVKIANHNPIGSMIILDQVGVIDGEKVRWKNFGYHIEEAIFYNRITNEPFLSYNSEDLYKKHLVEKDTDNSISVRDFLMDKMSGAFQNDLVDLAKKTNLNIRKTYNCSSPTILNIDEIECENIQVKVIYNYQYLN